MNNAQRWDEDQWSAWSQRQPLSEAAKSWDHRDTIMTQSPTSQNDTNWQAGYQEKDNWTEPTNDHWRQDSQTQQHTDWTRDHGPTNPDNDEGGGSSNDHQKRETDDGWWRHEIDRKNRYQAKHNLQTEPPTPPWIPQINPREYQADKQHNPTVDRDPPRTHTNTTLQAPSQTQDWSVWLAGQSAKNIAAINARKANKRQQPSKTHSADPQNTSSQIYAKNQPSRCPKKRDP